MKKIITVLFLLLLSPASAQQQTETFSLYMQSLAAATTPLTGSEPVIVLQGAVAKQTPVNNLLTAPVNGTITASALVMSVTGTSPLITLHTTNLTPGGAFNVNPAIFDILDCLGNNTIFEGCSGGFIGVSDDASVTTGTKGVLYGLQIAITPLLSRNNPPADDAAALIIANGSTNASKGTAAIYFGHNSGFSGSEWGDLINGDGNADTAIRMDGKYNYGLDFVGGGPAVFNNAAIRIVNNSAIVGRDAANASDVALISISSDNTVHFGSTTSSGLTLSGSIPYFNFNIGNKFPNINGGLAIAVNFSSGAGESDFINTNTSASDGFRWYIQTGATTLVMLAAISTSGVINAVGGFSANGSVGLTKTCTVNQALTLIFNLGILTGGSCNS